MDPLKSHIGDKKRRNYAACVTAMDDAVGQVVDLYKGKYKTNCKLYIIIIYFFNFPGETCDLSSGSIDTSQVKIPIFNFRLK